MGVARWRAELAAREKPPGLLLERSPGGKEKPDLVTFMESQMSKSICGHMFGSEVWVQPKKHPLPLGTYNLGSGMTLLIAPTWKGHKCTVTGEKTSSNSRMETHQEQERFAWEAISNGRGTWNPGIPLQMDLCIRVKWYRPPFSVCGPTEGTGRLSPIHSHARN